MCTVCASTAQKVDKQKQQQQQACMLARCISCRTSRREQDILFVRSQAGRLSNLTSTNEVMDGLLAASRTVASIRGATGNACRMTLAARGGTSSGFLSKAISSALAGSCKRRRGISQKSRTFWPCNFLQDMCNRYSALYQNVKVTWADEGAASCHRREPR